MAFLKTVLSGVKFVSGGNYTGKEAVLVLVGGAGGGTFRLGGLSDISGETKSRRCWMRAGVKHSKGKSQLTKSAEGGSML